MNLLLRRFLVATLLALSVSGPVQARVVAIGYVDLSCHEVTAELIKSVLERMGYNVSLHRGNAAAMFTKLAEGEIDLLVAAWLPHADAGPWLEHKDQLVKLSTLYDDARSFWAVPAYVPEAAVRSVADLRKTDVAEKMLKPIRVPNANLALLQGSTKIFAEYALRESGYSLSNGSTAEWMSGVKENLAAQKWFVLPLWRPHYLGAQFRVLEEPKQFLGGSNKAYLLASKDSKIDRSVVDLLKRMTMSNKAVADMDAKVFLESRTPHEAARYWMGEHPNTVEYWYTPDEADGEK